MIEEFLDRADDSQHDAFQAWRRANTHGAFLAFQTRRSAKLHTNGGCHHPGDANWTMTDDAASLTRKRKVAAPRTEDLVEWAEKNSISWSWCADCARNVGAPRGAHRREDGARASATLSRLRHTVGYAAAVFERICGPAHVDACGRLFADAIATVVDAGGAWSTTLNEDSVLLNAGPIRILNLSEESVWFATTEFLGDVPEGIEELTGERSTEHLYKSVPVPTREFMMEPSRVRDLPSNVREAFLAYVLEAAGRRRGVSLFISSHSPAVVAFLSELVGTPLPAPPGGDVADDGHDEPDYVEGRRRVFMLEVKERDPGARAACIAAHGARCAACGMSFGERYGELGEGFIEVHHLKKLSEATQERPVDPVRDLVPVCPNCHRMLHREDPPLTPSELAERIRPTGGHDDANTR